MDMLMVMVAVWGARGSRSEKSGGNISNFQVSERLHIPKYLA